MSELHAFQVGKLQLRTRNGIWQARVYLGERRYLWRSLKTSDIARATQLGTKLFYETQFKLQSGLPTHQRSFVTVIDEYVAMREKDHAQGGQACQEASSLPRVSHPGGYSVIHPVDMSS